MTLSSNFAPACRQRRARPPFPADRVEMPTGSPLSIWWSDLNPGLDHSQNHLSSAGRPVPSQRLLPAKNLAAQLLHAIISVSKIIQRAIRDQEFIGRRSDSQQRPGVAALFDNICPSHGATVKNSGSIDAMRSVTWSFSAFAGGIFAGGPGSHILGQYSIRGPPERLQDHAWIITVSVNIV